MLLPVYLLLPTFISVIIILISYTETLRKYPALPFLSRESLEDYTFENTKVTIPKETMIWVPVFPIHRDPEIYPDPEKFDPERFSEDKMKERNPMYYLPFGHGPRNCVGTYLAKNRSVLS